jgi:hypothetical protein
LSALNLSELSLVIVRTGLQVLDKCRFGLDKFVIEGEGRLCFGRRFTDLLIQINIGNILAEHFSDD